MVVANQQNLDGDGGGNFFIRSPTHHPMALLYTVVSQFEGEGIGAGHAGGGGGGSARGTTSPMCALLCKMYF